MKTYHMYHSETISAEGKLKEAEKQEEKQMGRADPVFSIRMEDKYQRRSTVKKIEKMKEKVEWQGFIFLQVLIEPMMFQSRSLGVSVCSLRERKQLISV